MANYYKEKSKNSETTYFSVNMQTNSYLMVCTIETDFFINSRKNGADIRFSDEALKKLEKIDYNEFRLAFNHAVNKLTKINEYINKF